MISCVPMILFPETRPGGKCVIVSTEGGREQGSSRNTKEQYSRQHTVTQAPTLLHALTAARPELPTSMRPLRWRVGTGAETGAGRSAARRDTEAAGRGCGGSLRRPHGLQLQMDPPPSMLSAGARSEEGGKCVGAGAEQPPQ